MKYLLTVVMLCLSIGVAWTCNAPSPGLKIQFQSYEHNNWDGQLHIHLRMVVQDSIELLDSFTLDSLGYNMSLNGPLTLGSGHYAKGDTIDTSFVMNYDTNSPPYYPQQCRLRLAYSHFPGDVDYSYASFYLYFTPYRSIEVWDATDFNQQGRIWLMGQDNPSKPYVDPALIPTSNVPVNFHPTEEWQDQFVEWRVPGLAYAVPMQAIHPDSADSSILLGSFLLYRYQGTIEGRLSTDLLLEPREFFSASRSLVGIRVELWQEGWPVPLASGYTDMEGNFSFPIDFRRNSQDIDIFLRIKARNAEHNIKVYSQYPFTSVAQFQLPSVNLVHDNNGPENHNFQNITLNEDELRALSLVYKSWEFFDEVSSNQYSLSPGLNILTGSGNPTSFFWPNALCPQVPDAATITTLNTLAFFQPHIQFTSNALNAESTAWHEFGHFVMWQLQNECYTELLTATGSHSLWQEVNPRLAWTEGFADAWAALTDLHYHFLDHESAYFGKYDMERGRRFELTHNIELNGFFNEYLIARALRDLFDGDAQVLNCYNYNASASQQPLVADVGQAGSANWEPGHTDTYEMDINLIFEAVAMGSSRDGDGNGQVSSIIDFYENLMSIIPCEDKAAIHEIFEQNKIVMGRDPADGIPEVGLNIDRLWEVANIVTTNGRNSNVQTALNGYDYILDWTGYTDFSVDLMPYYLERDNISSQSTDFNLAQYPGGSDETCILGDVAILEDGLLSINADAPIDNTLTGATKPATGSHFTVYVENGTLSLRDGNPSVIHDAGTIEVGSASGATTADLIFKDDATPSLGGWDSKPEVLKIHSGSKVVFEQNASLDLGNLTIQLLGTDAELVFSSSISIRENAHVQIEGSGKVYFQGDKNMFDIYEACQLSFNGSISAPLQLIVDQSDLYFFKQDEEYEQITFNYCDVQLSHNSRVCIGGSALLNESHFHPAVSGEQPRGIYLYGQPNTLVSHCSFDHLRYGIYSANYKGNKLELIDCDFNNCTYGVFQSRHSAEIIGCNFNQCQTAWYARGASLPGYMAAGSIHHCGQGISFFGNTNLHLNSPNIYDNSTTGVDFYGRSFSSWCGNIANNHTGLQGVFQELLLSPKFKPYSGYMDFSDNRYGINMQGKYLRLNWGKNDLVSLLPLYGTNLDINAQHVAWYAAHSGIVHISQVLASDNKWDNKAADNFPQYQSLAGPTPYGNQYINSLDPFGGLPTPTLVKSYQEINSRPACPVVFDPIDPNFVNGFVDAESEFHNPEHGTPMLDMVPLVGHSNHEFQNTPLQQAVQTTVTDLYTETLNNRYTQATERFALILRAVDNELWEYAPDPYVDYVVDYAYLRMMEAFEYACLYEGALDNGSTLLADQVIAAQQDLIALVEAETDPGVYTYTTRFVYNMDLATTQWLIEDHSSATTTLGNMQLWTNGHELSITNSTLCRINYEHDVLQGTIALTDVGSTPYPCQESFVPPAIVDPEVTSSPEAIEAHALALEVFPNPADGELKVQFGNSMPAQCSMSIYNTQGKLVWQSGLLEKEGFGGFSIPTSSLSNGVYYLKAQTAQGISSTSFSVQH